jgi:hypothetical protein
LEEHSRTQYTEKPQDTTADEGTLKERGEMKPLESKEILDLIVCIVCTRRGRLSDAVIVLSRKRTWTQNIRTERFDLRVEVEEQHWPEAEGVAEGGRRVGGGVGAIRSEKDLYERTRRSVPNEKAKKNGKTHSKLLQACMNGIVLLLMLLPELRHPLS